MAFTSFIPVVGTALVWVPAVGYLLLLGKIKSAIFLATWCAVLVGSIDNFLRPFFMRGQADMSTFYIFLAILGGVQFFGLAGIIYGPLILGFARVMLYIYQIEYRDFLEERPPAGPPPGGEGLGEKEAASP
jgi:predicted PurR-regulated permease PerM